MGTAASRTTRRTARAKARKGMGTPRARPGAYVPGGPRFGLARGCEANGSEAPAEAHRGSSQADVLEEVVVAHVVLQLPPRQHEAGAREAVADPRHGLPG